jgi:NAD(P)-dependent dehydrogenase (short-subunit alcohol dehydrogenase family)
MSDFGNVALVTGAGRGIGRAIAVRLSAEGLRVALVARSEDQLLETAALCASETAVLSGDITSTLSVDTAFTSVEAQWGPVSVLVANAGAGAAAPIHLTSDDQWSRMIDVNLTAPFRAVRRAVPHMIQQNQGRIVVVASTAAKHGDPYVSAYTASKHGVLGLVRSAAAELAHAGVTVNAVCPGYVDTPMTQTTISGIIAKTGRTSSQARAVLAGKQPIGRLITPEEVADAVWLCIANGAINGQGINVDGGWVQS